MTAKRSFGVMLATTAMLAAGPLIASQSCTDDAMLVFDGSGSMSEMGFNLLDEPRIFEARRAVQDSMPQIAAVRRVGLVIYGPGQPEACGNIQLRFAPRPNAAGPIIDAVDRLQPAGETPLTKAVERAAEVLNYRADPGVIVLLTDGKETCNGQPCTLASELAADAHDLTVHVIGFKVRDDHFGWDDPQDEGYERRVTVARCLADRTGGTYASAETLDELTEALTRTLGCQLIGQRAGGLGHRPS
ncbi:vWA domain-containing protein [uncultured Roseobacter sp.]|uniref:vWA domain-containing protein n=1 Tax=uncultured Roseobacter sp. TaxID=114847 RepID=UPI00261D5C96|nr:vWA domain-containing protein [uncultured Roseobacter sp.]